MQEYFIFCMEQMTLLRAWDLNAFALRMNYVWEKHHMPSDKDNRGLSLKKMVFKTAGLREMKNGPSRQWKLPVLLCH